MIANNTIRSVILEIKSDQGRIQTTSTYASAEVTSSVVKLLKKIPEYPFSPANYFILFFCRSKRLKRPRPRYAVVILLFLEIFENLVIFKKIFENPLVVPHVCFSNACRIQQNTGLTDYRLCCTAITLTLHG